MQETVLLVHGVLMTARVMAVLARRLRGCGYRTVLFDYPTRGRCLRDNAHSLARFVGGLGSPTVHLVGHSMGGMLFSTRVATQVVTFLRSGKFGDVVGTPLLDGVA